LRAKDGDGGRGSEHIAEATGTEEHHQRLPCTNPEHEQPH
jgi:hypothetical protein